ncbi:hypothetical protein PITC_086770 [Penicillium italicum]|uniref:Uncharacterized protein n=1 Tax=Penicillium italicum TaxID=40296 RepID=A0A0A2KBE2_PENIT|nr:hypothetical protein PITC_086770 [Penicillium italicum]
MSSNIAGTGTVPQPKKRYVVFSVRQVRGNWCNRIKKLKRFFTNLRVHRHFGLSSVRPDDNTPEEPLIPKTDKAKEDIEPQSPAEAESAEETPKEQDESSPAEVPNLDPSQVRSGSGIAATGKRYFKYLRVPPNSPDRDSAETTPKGTTRINVFPKENFKSPHVVQKAKETSRTVNVARVPLINRWDNHPSVRRKPNQPASLHEYWEMQMRLRGLRIVPESNH